MCFAQVRPLLSLFVCMSVFLSVVSMALTSCTWHWAPAVSVRNSEVRGLKPTLGSGTRRQDRQSPAYFPGQQSVPRTLRGQYLRCRSCCPWTCFQVYFSSSPSASLPMVATSHMWPLSPWNVSHAKCAVSVKHTPDSGDLARMQNISLVIINIDCMLQWWYSGYTGLD